jgi:hypothetical protein
MNRDQLAEALAEIDASEGIASLSYQELAARIVASEQTARQETMKANGVRDGRPPKLPDATVFRIVNLRKDGKSYGEIARTLNSEGVTTALGKEWFPATVSNTDKSQQAARLRERLKTAL